MSLAGDCQSFRTGEWCLCLSRCVCTSFPKIQWCEHFFQRLVCSRASRTILELNGENRIGHAHPYQISPVCVRLNWFYIFLLIFVRFNSFFLIPFFISLFFYVVVHAIPVDSCVRCQHVYAQHQFCGFRSSNRWIFIKKYRNTMAKRDACYCTANWQCAESEVYFQIAKQIRYILLGRTWTVGVRRLVRALWRIMPITIHLCSHRNRTNYQAFDHKKQHIVWRLRKQSVDIKSNKYFHLDVKDDGFGLWIDRAVF